jgi:hypothetical protein
MMGVFDELKENKIKPEDAKALSKVATTVVNTTRIKLDYEIHKHKREAAGKTLKIDILE